MGGAVSAREACGKLAVAALTGAVWGAAVMTVALWLGWVKP